ncbi:PH (Pleckstrin Homology) domain-containing protein [Dysgonomonas alginatilytica]|uniref:PH (Pleckstrin Homology) domain-containing protein n=1 Tax=Dysgonomonas alginatilytica TaxID=1605892 RepID=A0A2V3PRP7_9BACT|nr:BREX system ATP-binding domain-containing protein [Dysgonomonas alginatilytica]PXV67369.1 PH (Pleckstrin Homology) domain-containing protein [Dysgonomonas alginatilytica]
MELNIKPKEATAIINSLIGGVVPKIGVQHITVGRTDEVEMFVKAMDNVKEGHSMVKFWIGDFGSGKSFMLHLLTTVALKQRFVVSNADFTPHTRLYSNDGKAQSLYTSLVDNIAVLTKPEGGALSILLEKWIEQAIMQTAAENSIELTKIRDTEYLPAIRNTIMKTTNEITEVGGFDFGLVIVKYYEGFIAADDELKKNALKWLKGEYTTKTEAKNDLGVSDIINDRNYYEMLKNLTKLFVKIGYSGFVINLDECINLYKISNTGMRQKNYEKLMSMYNDCFQGKIEHLFLNFAGTSETLEDKVRGFYSYDALKTRLKVNKFETAKIRDFAQPVIRLMPLSDNEIFVLLKNLKEIFDFNYNVSMDFSDGDIQHFMEEVYNKPNAAEFLTPREVIRDFLNILNILRQNPETDKNLLIAEIQVSDERPLDLEEAQEIDRAEKVKKIMKQYKSLNFSPQFTDKLVETLLDDENCLRVVVGSFKNKAGTLIATEKRLVFINKQLNFVESFPYSQITELHYARGTQNSSLYITRNDEKLSVDLIPNVQIKPLIALLESQIEILERKTLAAELAYWNKLIKNAEIKMSLSKMERVAFIIQEKDSSTEETFFLRHTETLSKLLSQYCLLENSGLETEETKTSMQRIEEAIRTAGSAFEQELNTIFKTEMMSVDAESEVYLDNLRNKGFIES